VVVVAPSSPVAPVMVEPPPPPVMVAPPPPPVMVAPPQPPIMPPPPTVVVIAAPPPPATVLCAAAPVAPAESVMRHPWSLGLSLGSMALAPEHDRDDEIHFAIGELALRYRATPELELEVSAGGGRQRVDDHEGDLVVGQVMLAARYHFFPEARWSWFLTAGIGAVAVTREDPTDDEIDDATRPAAMVGIGVERRFHHFALQAEARAIGVGNRHDLDDDDDRAGFAPTAMAVSPTTPIERDERQAGGSLTLGLNYYF
jgi:hypothetical protein